MLRRLPMLRIRISYAPVHVMHAVGGSMALEVALSWTRSRAISSLMDGS